MVWGVSALFTPSWWESPGFQHVLLPLPVYAVAWLAAGAIMWWTLNGAVPVAMLATALGLYAFSTLAVGMSVVIATISEGQVSAIGSAVAWLGYGVAAAARLHTLVEAVSATGRADE